MLGFLTGLSLRTWLMVAGVSIFLVVAYKIRGFVLEKWELEQEVFTQEIQLQSKDARIEVLEKEKEAALRAKEIATEELIRAQARADTLRGARTIIRESKSASADDPAPEILQETLEALRTREAK